MPATLTITPWPDPLLDTLGHDPRSLYVETFWLPTLGPTAVLLLRHLATRFDESPAGLELPVADTSQALGLGQRDGNSSPIVRTLTRLSQFDLACDDGRGTVAVRRNAPSYARPGDGGRREVPGPEEVTRDAWEKLVGRQMQILISADGTPGVPGPFSEADEKDDDWSAWNRKRDEQGK